jgi:hypothetical protein
MDKAALIILAVYIAATAIGYVIYLIEFNFFNKEDD